MDIYNRIPYLKKTLKLTNEDFGEPINMNASAFGQAFRRKSLSVLQIKELEKVFNLDSHSKMPEVVLIQKSDNSIQDYIKTLHQLLEVKDELAAKEKRIQFLESEIARLTKIE